MTTRLQNGLKTTFSTAVLFGLVIPGLLGGCNALSMNQKYAGGWLTHPSRKILRSTDEEKESVVLGQPKQNNHYRSDQTSRPDAMFSDGTQDGTPRPPAVPFGYSEAPNVEAMPAVSLPLPTSPQPTPQPPMSAQPMSATPVPPPFAGIPENTPVATTFYQEQRGPVDPFGLTATVPSQPTGSLPMPSSTISPAENVWNVPMSPPPGIPEPTHLPAHLPTHLPWAGLPDLPAPGELPPSVSGGASIEEVAAKEELAREKNRLLEIAKKNQKDGTPKHLQPLPPWGGDFTIRETNGKDPDEKAIIQASHFEPHVRMDEKIELYDWEKDEQKFDWESLDPVNFFTKVRDWAGFGPDEKKAMALMEKGREIILDNPDLKDRKKSDEAAKLFLQAAKRWPDSVLAEDSLYMAGECYFFSDNYPKALMCYKQLVSDYHQSKHLDTSVRRLFAIGRYWEKQSFIRSEWVNWTDRSRPRTDLFGNAKQAYEAVFTNDPNGPISDDAVMALAMGYLARGKEPGDAAFENAGFYFSYLREHYPNSKHIVKAHEMELHALTNSHHGPEYNMKSIEQAAKLAEQTLRQFGTDLNPDEKREIVEIQEGVLEKTAEHDFTMGLYYEKKRCCAAARMYYEKVVREYPQSPFAEKARTHIAGMEGMPDEPGHFEWFNDLVKSTKKARASQENSEFPSIADERR